MIAWDFEIKVFDRLGNPVRETSAFHLPFTLLILDIFRPFYACATLWVLQCCCKAWKLGIFLMPTP
jgi:hypothetical protein